MIPLEVTNGHRLLVDQLSRAALVDLSGLLASVGDLDPRVRQDVLREAFPEVFDPYAVSVSEVSATFYEELRDYQGVRGSFTAESLAGEAPDRWRALAGWGSSPAVFEQGGTALMFSLLSGGLQSVLTEMAADTVIGNAEVDRASMGYQRVPKGGCCAFCGLLASRGAAYTSAEAAGGVVGRGMPVEKTKGKRGRQAKGIKPRGSRRVGQSFHDSCRCTVVPVHEGNTVQLQADADRYYNSYRDAADKVTSGLELTHTTTKAPDGSLKNDYQWVDATGRVSPEQKTKNILAGMRADLGVK